MENLYLTQLLEDFLSEIRIDGNEEELVIQDYVEKIESYYDWGLVEESFDDDWDWSLDDDRDFFDDLNRLDDDVYID